jgi:Sigma-54 interaction domain
MLPANAPGDLPPTQPRNTALIGRSQALKVVQQEIEYAARSDAKVLIMGASGVGKEVVAHLIHARSRRRHAPMLTINCAAMPDTLLESELFGHARGSFTDAYRDKRGLFEAASSGTVFMKSARCRCACRRCCSASSKPARSSGWATSAIASTPTCAWSRRPTGASPNASRRASSGRTSTTA